MSWSFTVKEKTVDDAGRVFNNKLLENRPYIQGEDLHMQLAYAAAQLSRGAKDGHFVMLGCSGHVNADGTMWASVTINTMECIPEEVPNAPGETVIVDGATAAVIDEPAALAEVGTCSVCGKPMPPGEEMFKYHGYSGPCPE